MKTKMLKYSDPENAAAANRKYRDALVEFYDALPRGEGKTYYKELMEKGKDFKECYDAWAEKTKGLKIEFMDSDNFGKYYEEEKAKSVKKNETAAAAAKKQEEADKKKAEAEAAAKKKAEEEAAAKEEELMSLEGEEPKEKEEKKPDVEVEAWPELDNLKNAGFAFEGHIQYALKNLGAGELSKSGTFYPKACAEMEADGNFAGLADYKDLVENVYKVPTAEFEKLTKAVQDAKTAAKEVLTTAPGLKDWFADKYFQTVYIRVFAKHEGVPSVEWLNTKLEEHPNDKFTPFIKQALKYEEDISPTDRKNFNELFAKALVAGREWAKFAKTLDAKLLETSETLITHRSNSDVLAANKYVVDAITQRAEMAKVYKALITLNSKGEKAEKESNKYQKDLDKEDKANTALIVVIVLALLLTVGGITYCKCAKKCCFAEKDEELAAEGGQTDKSLFKKEVKSKKAHKKQVKESLMPEFKVAEEQA